MMPSRFIDIVAHDRISFFVCVLVFFFFYFSEVLVSWPGIEAGPIAVKALSPNRWMPDSLYHIFFIHSSVSEYRFFSCLGYCE